MCPSRTAREPRHAAGGQPRNYDGRAAPAGEPAISRTSLRFTASPKASKSATATTKAPGPPITFSS